MKRTGNALWSLFQLAAVAAVFWWAGTTLIRQWDAVRSIAAGTRIEWPWVGAASLLVLLTFAALIQSWRMLLAGMGGNLSFSVAARIWTIANLGRYVPGKLWSVGALGMLANRAGVSAVSAASAAIIGTLLNIGAGLGILSLSGSRVLGAFKPWLQQVALGGALLFAIGTLILPRVLPAVLIRLSRWRGEAAPATALATALPSRTLWLATAINVLSWIGYGLAFALFARGVAPQVTATPLVFVVIWTASYLSGYLALVVPGGLGVREVAMAGAFVTFGLSTLPDATFLALASRVWLTVWEILPGVFFLVFSPVVGKTDDGAAGQV